jgi:hypothetical protein
MSSFFEHTSRILTLSPASRGVSVDFSNKNGCFDFKSFMEFQCQEIRKHRYLESEKAGRDLGTEAELDWIHKYSKKVREWAEATQSFISQPNNQSSQEKKEN